MFKQPNPELQHAVCHLVNILSSVLDTISVFSGYIRGISNTGIGVGTTLFCLVHMIPAVLITLVGMDNLFIRYLPIMKF